MSFLYPHLLWLALVAPLAVVAVAMYAEARRRQATAQIGPLLDGLATGASAPRRWAKTALVAAAVLLFAVALARPRYGTTARDGKRDGLDLVIALDVSQSMLAEDVSPSRLEKAKAELGRLVDGLRGDRVGLVLFAGDAFVQAPLTSDYGALRMLLDNASPDDLPTPGTDFGVALDAALDAFGPAPPEGVRVPSRVVLFVSDGENHVANLAELKARATERGATMIAAGVGETGGAPIPLRGADGTASGFKTDADGREVRTRLEDAALRDLSDGRYVHVGRTGVLAGPVAGMLDQMQRTDLDADPFAEYAEQFAWPLVLGLLLLLADLRLDARPRPASSRDDDEALPAPAAIAPKAAPAASFQPATPPPPPIKAKLPKATGTARATGTAAALALLVVLTGCGARGDGLAGNRALLFGDDARAAERFAAGLERQNANGDTLAGTVRARLFNNLGLALLGQRGATLDADTSEASAPRLDSLARMALAAFERAFAASPTDRLHHATAYNGGLAAAAAQDDARALDRFRSALLLDPSDEDAAYNWEYVARHRRDRSGGQGGAGQDGKGSAGQNGGDPSAGNGQQDPQDGKDGQPRPGEQQPKPGEEGRPQDGTGQQPGDEGQPSPRGRLSREEAGRILDAVGQEEGRVRRQLRGRPEAPVRVEKDW